MKDFLINTFTQYPTIIVFLHVLSAILWIGGMIAVRFAVHPVLRTIKDPKEKMEKTLKITGNLFNLVTPFIVTLLITALFLSVGLEFKGTDLYRIVHLKEVIWTIMTLNFIYMYLKRKSAQKLFESGDLAQAKLTISRIPNLLLPVNIFLGLAAVLCGVILRGY